MIELQDLLNNGRLKSFSYDGKSLIVEEKTAPVYHVTFEVIDKRLKRQKKAAIVSRIDVTVPQDQLHKVWKDVLDELHKLEKQAIKE